MSTTKIGVSTLKHVMSPKLLEKAEASLVAQELRSLVGGKVKLPKDEPQLVPQLVGVKVADRSDGLEVGVESTE